MKKKLFSYAKFYDIHLTDIQIEKFVDYYKFLIKKNKVMNLTSIVKEEEVVLKHFIDSLMIIKYLNLNESKIIDIGTGAGFPGIPLAIVLTDCDFLLTDALMKRVNFINEVVDICNLTNVKCIHGRAENLSKISEYREKYDYCVSRAVSNLSVLLEYCTPFIRVGGKFIAYKSGLFKEELLQSDNAQKILNCSFVDSIDFSLQFLNDAEIKSDSNTNYHSDSSKVKYNDNDCINRSFLIFNKNSKTPDNYPRSSKKINKNSL